MSGGGRSCLVRVVGGGKRLPRLSRRVPSGRRVCHGNPALSLLSAGGMPSGWPLPLSQIQVCSWDAATLLGCPQR